MTEEDLRTMVREFRSSMTAELDATNRRFEVFADEMRNRFSTMESAFVNEIRALGRRLDRMDKSLGSIDERLGTIEGRLDVGE